jgi:glutamyl-tRNA synthetase
MTVRTRFAPSPTGYMHVGNLRTALFTYLLAKHDNGTFILRIEDTDQEREVAGATELIYKTLRQVGLNYDEGPDVGGDYGPYIQTQRRGLYKKYAQELVEKGGAYYCFCTKERLDQAREEAEKKGETFKYDKHCLNLPKEEIERRIAAGEPYVIRQNIPTEGTASFDDVLYGHVEVECKTLDDNVLIKADGLPTYNFANVVDDHLMGITHVVRGTEYLSSAPKYNLLYKAFGWQPPLYVHVTPVMRDSQHKLSKRHGDPTFEDLRNMGYLDEAIMNYLALLGWSPSDDTEFFTLEELTRAFDLKGLSKSPSIFDINKLTWFNAEYMRKLSPEKYLEIATPWFEKVLDKDKFDFKRLAELLQGRTEVLNRLPEMIDFLGQMPEFELDLYTHKKMKTNPEVALTALKAMKPVLEGIADWSEPVLHDTLMAAIQESGMKNGQVLWPLRIAISGKASTPGGAIEIAYLLGKDETLRRLDQSIAQLEAEK